MKTYNREEVYAETLSYFSQDDLAANVFIDKYCLKDTEGNFLELTPDDMHRRLAKEFARIEKKFGGKNQLSEEEIYNWFKDFKYIVPQGSVMYGLGNDYSFNSLSNCTVIDSPEDNISSIINTGRDMANLFKMRCGVGVDISNLRPDGAAVNNSARTSTGAWSFVKLYSEFVNTIGQKGRRGAGMVSIRGDHPDVVKFISSKKNLASATGVNISIKIFDKFMEAVVAGEDYLLIWEDEKNRYEEKVDARELWDVLVKAATDTAEPGILFWDRHIDYNPSSSYEQLRALTTNPCAEQALPSAGACRLTSCNLRTLVNSPLKSGASVDYETLKRAYSVATRLGDDLVELELEKIKKIMDKADKGGDTETLILWKKFYDKGKAGRRIGTGCHGLADMLASLGLRYDSKEGLEEVDRVFKIIRDTVYTESVNLSKERGAFELFDWEKEKSNEFIKALPDGILKVMSKHGRRNVCLLTCAPTGSVSICSQSSSGIEPIFRRSYTRRRKINKGAVESSNRTFTAKDGQVFEEFSVDHPLVSMWRKNNPNVEVLPEYFVSSEEIDWEYRIKVQSRIQKYIDSSISSTINLPRGTDYKVVGDLYMQAWEQGLKGITVYVEGSREGILVSEDGDKDLFKYHDATKRPEILECEIHRIKVHSESWVTFVGLMDGKPYEVFSGRSKHISFPKKYDKGHIVKRPYKTKPSEYDLYLNMGTEDEIIVHNIVESFLNSNESVLGRLISLSLRHGSRPAHLSAQLLKDPSLDFVTYSKSIGRCLKKYISNGEVPETGKNCQECGDILIYQEGCKLCMGCGWSRCS